MSLRKIDKFRQPELAEVRQTKLGHLFQNMAERVRAFVVVLRCVRRVPDPDAVENNNERAHVAHTPIGCHAVFISTVSRIQ